jgi:hypothetical protein
MSVRFIPKFNEHEFNNIMLARGSGSGISFAMETKYEVLS